MLNSHKIIVKWHTSSHAACSTRYCWENSELAAMEEDLDLEVSLGWPTGTLAILRAAFDRKLNRFTSWNLSSIPQRRAHQAAAAAYMRGVPCSPPAAPDEARSGSYTVQISHEPAAEFASLLRECFVVCDNNVLKAWPRILHSQVDCILEDIHEDKKNLSTLAQIIQAAPPTKSWLIIGGGISCDMAAYAAYLCKAPFTLVPTTLLAMVDAAVGGKTGVNFAPYGKNLLGSFTFPERVLIHTQWLESLPIAEFYAGAGECFKHALLAGNTQLLDELCIIFSSRNFTRLAQHLCFLVDVKAQIVQRDPFEHGERSVLNLGHTLAHALEAVALEAKTQTVMRHGEAVSIGLVFEAQLAWELDYLPKQDFDFIKKILENAGIFLTRTNLERCLGFPLSSAPLVAKLLHHMRLDKKNTASEAIPFVLLQQPGIVVSPNPQTWVVSVPKVTVQQALEAFLLHY